MGDQKWLIISQTGQIHAAITWTKLMLITVIVIAIATVQVIAWTSLT